MLGLSVGIGTLNGDDKTPPTGGPLKFNVTMTFVFSLPIGADVTLTAKVTEKSCRGEAGCAVTWHPQVAYFGPELSSNVPWTVIYRVVGYDTDGRVRMVEIDGTTPAKQPDEHV